MVADCPGARRLMTEMLRSDRALAYQAARRDGVPAGRGVLSQFPHHRSFVVTQSAIVLASRRPTGIIEGYDRYCAFSR